MINLLEGEKIILETRKHWLPIAAEAALFLVLALAPFLVFWFRNFLPSATNEFVSQNQNLVLFLITAWVQFVWVAFSIIWTNYYLDIFIVTNKRIIDIEQLTLFNRYLAQLSLDKIQDVRVAVGGFLPSLLNFGDLHIQTAGESREFFIKDLPAPYQVQELILKLKADIIAGNGVNS